MKTKLILAAGLFVSIACAQVPSPLRITTFDRTTATLAWTNQACANNPVYEVLSTTIVTGTWQHAFFVTNRTSATLTNPLGTNGGAVFHKLQWIGEAPITFDYLFDEGFGVGPCVSGKLQLALSCDGTTSGSWHFAETGFCIDEGHPVGNGNIYRAVLRTNVMPHSIELFFTPGPEGEFLRGTMQTTTTNGRVQYTGMAGTVYLRGFAGDTELGTFAATREP